MNMRKIYIILSGLWLLFSFGCGNNDAQTKADSTKTNMQAIPKDSTETKASHKVTFVELGSVNCIPCKMMQPVMKAIEEEFGDQVEVVFHDVWKDRAPAEQYRIRVIPTQVFLDETGKEFFRHEGFYPKEEIEKLLIDKGLKKIEKVETKKG
ncbi:MAG: thioredoxin family protein [bacterium]|nr:MAG: thioredoxin family protein [bacterium]